MKKLLIILVAIGLYAQKVELELVWEREFGNPIVDYAVNVEKKEKIPKITVISFSNNNKVQIFFMNQKGEMRKLIKTDLIGGILRSKNRKFWAIYEITKGKLGNVEEVNFYLYDYKGTLLWEKYGISGLPLALLNDRILLTSSNPWGWNSVKIFKKGDLIIEIKPTFAEISSGSFDFSMNGYVIFNVSGHKGVNLVLYDSLGKEIWRKNENWKWAGKVKISDNGKYIAAIALTQDGKQGLFLYSQNGELLWKYESYHGYHPILTFSPEGEYIGADAALGKILLFKCNNGKILWNYELENKRQFFSMAISKDGNFVALSDGGGYGDKPLDNERHIYLFNKKGELLWRKMFNNEPFKITDVRFLDNGKYLIIKNYNKLYCYEIKEVDDGR